MILAMAHASPIVNVLLRHPVRRKCPPVDLVADVQLQPVRMRLNRAPDAARPERIGMARQPENDQCHGQPKPKRPEQCEVSQGSDVTHRPNIGTGPAFVKKPSRLRRFSLLILIRTNIPGVRGQRPRPLLLRKAPSC